MYEALYVRFNLVGCVILGITFGVSAASETVPHSPSVNSDLLIIRLRFSIILVGWWV